MEQGYPNKSSVHSQEGTIAHAMAAEMLMDRPIDKLVSEALQFYANERNPQTSVDEMLRYVGIYVNNVKEYATGGELMVERSIPLKWIHERVAADRGTADAVIIHDDEIQIHDLKFGRGVEVEAKENDQLKIYAISALKEYDAFGPFKRVKVVIHQPRVTQAPKEWDTTVDQLATFEDEVRQKASAVLGVLGKPEECPEELLTPGEKQCRFCRAKADCQAYTNAIKSEIVGSIAVNDFTPEAVTEATRQVSNVVSSEELARKYAILDFVKSWCKAVEERIYEEMLSGTKMPGLKLVEGRRGNRRWVSSEEAEQLLKSMRFKQEQMYNFTLISPTDAEKLVKAESPRRWNKLEALIIRDEGRPVIAPESDKRPAITNETNDFGGA